MICFPTTCRLLGNKLTRNETNHPTSPDSHSEVSCTSEASPTSAEPPATTPTSSPSKLLYKDPSQPLEVRLEDLLARMTLDEKIAQMVQPIQNATSAGDVEAFSLGAMLSTAESISEDNSLADWTRIPGAYLEAAAKTRLGIPLLYGVDSMHGFGHVNGATIFPHNIGLGATHNPALVEEIGQAVAEQMRAARHPVEFRAGGGRASGHPLGAHL